jgi:hypothetical protein
MGIKIEPTSGTRGKGALVYLCLAVVCGGFAAAVAKGMTSGPDVTNEFVTLYRDLGSWATTSMVLGGLAALFFLMLTFGSLLSDSQK